MKLLTIATGFFIVLLSFFEPISAQNIMETKTRDPIVLTAVSPPFVPFILGKSGQFEMYVEVQINPSGSVVKAKLVRYTLFVDKSAEDTAMMWQFDKSDIKLRKAVIKFVFTIVDSEDPILILPTIFRFPYEIEVRHRIFKQPSDIDPREDL